MLDFDVDMYSLFYVCKLIVGLFCFDDFKGLCMLVLF